MTTDPGDLVLDPTCGSGTTAFVAEKWGRRWITCDTSRVAITLAKQRLMTASFDYFALRYPHEGLKGGFDYETVPHITLKSIANNAEIDVIWDRLQPAVDAALAALNTAMQSHATPFKVETGGRAGQKIDFTASGEIQTPLGRVRPRKRPDGMGNPTRSPDRLARRRDSRAVSLLDRPHHPPTRNRREHQCQGRVRVPV